MNPGAYCRRLGHPHHYIVEAETPDGVICHWFDEYMDFHRGFIPSRELMPVLGGAWPAPEPAPKEKEVLT